MSSTPPPAEHLIDTLTTSGLLDTADTHPARRLVDIVTRGQSESEHDDIAALAAAFCVRGLRLGSTAIDPTTLAETTIDADLTAEEVRALPWPSARQWSAALDEHPLFCVTTDDRPIRVHAGRLYLQKYWQQESLVETFVAGRAGIVRPHDPDVLAAALADYFPTAATDPQRLAAAVVALSGFTILAGGPGTGKTTTIARVIAVLRTLEGKDLNVALAAPTGKAAARMAEATKSELTRLAADRPVPGRTDIPASTLHRLLGWRPDSSRFRHNRLNPLPHDVIIIDEASMVSLTMMARLLEAVRPDARLILVGDPDQLTSIEAGAVLSDLVSVAGPPADALQEAIAAVAPHEATLPIAATSTITLNHQYRFGGVIAQLAAAVNAGAADAAVGLLEKQSTDEGGGRLELVAVPPEGSSNEAVIEALRADVTSTNERVHRAAALGDARAALAALDEHRLLCAHRTGPYGVEHWNRIVRSWFAPRPWGEDWTVGQGLIVTANDYSLGLFNGDTGVIIAGPDEAPIAAFPGLDGPMLIPPIRLDAVTSLDAITIHRGQGSQFDAVTIILPPPDSPLLTRELLYTGITRAKQRVRIIGSVDSVRVAVSHRVTRASGLTERLEAALLP